nr:hypothetical protein [Propioniciclava sp. MC1683]
MIRSELTSTPMITTAMSRPTMASACGKPAQAPATPPTTASEVRASVRACWPSATRADEPMRRPRR